MFRAHDVRQRIRQIHLQIHHQATLMRLIVPARARQFDDLPHRTVELAHARNRPGDIFDGALNRGQVIAGAFAQIGLALEERLGIQQDRRNGIVDVVGYAAGHLPQCPQPLLLHDGVLALAQVVIRLLQSAVEAHMVTGQCHMLAELLQKLTFAAAEGVIAAACADQYTEYLVLDDEGQEYQRAQTNLRQPLGKGKGDPNCVRFVDQLPRNAAGQSIWVDGYLQ